MMAQLTSFMSANNNFMKENNRWRSENEEKMSFTGKSRGFVFLQKAELREKDLIIHDDMIVFTAALAAVRWYADPASVNCSRRKQTRNRTAADGSQNGVVYFSRGKHLWWGPFQGNANPPRRASQPILSGWPTLANKQHYPEEGASGGLHAARYLGGGNSWSGVIKIRQKVPSLTILWKARTWVRWSPLELIPWIGYKRYKLLRYLTGQGRSPYGTLSNVPDYTGSQIHVERSRWKNNKRAHENWRYYRSSPVKIKIFPFLSLDYSKKIYRNWVCWEKKMKSLLGFFGCILVSLRLFIGKGKTRLSVPIATLSYSHRVI